MDELGIPAPANIINLHNNLLYALKKAYPKWVDSWRIELDQNGGMVTVRNTELSGEMGFLIKMVDAQGANGGQLIVRHAGELFERYNVSREKWIDKHDEIGKLKINSLGKAVHD